MSPNSLEHCAVIKAFGPKISELVDAHGNPTKVALMLDAFWDTHIGNRCNIVKQKERNWPSDLVHECKFQSSMESFFGPWWASTASEAEVTM